MHNTVVVLGSQWGDEGKGKVVDLLTDQADWVVRFQGGHNAGHTLVIDGVTTALSLVPSGILNPKARCLIGGGVVLSPEMLFKELDMLAERGIETQQRVFVSQSCHLLLPIHVALDQAREQALKTGAIGTTGRGIGPAYEDKVARRGLRLADLLNPKTFTEKLTSLLHYHNFILSEYYQQAPLDIDKMRDDILAYGERLKPMMTNSVTLLQQARMQGQCILFEGAQGAMLDIDHGTYPYVTSSNTTAGGVATGAGVGPRFIDYILGVTKAYCTRVGAGPMPTQLDDEVGRYLADKGHERGTVTGRARRCGWFDVPLMRHSVQVNSLSALCITKLDVLDELPEIKICVDYALGDKICHLPPAFIDDFAACQPVYETLPGWQTKTAGITDYAELPSEAQQYLSRISELVGTPIDMLSTGPERKEVAIIRHPFAK